jgi:hypothetical protein
VRIGQGDEFVGGDVEDGIHPVILSGSPLGRPLVQAKWLV